MINEEYFQQLNNGVIFNAGYQRIYDEYYICFDVRKKTGETLSVTVLMDPEGNGPGFLDIFTNNNGD